MAELSRIEVDEVKQNYERCKAIISTFPVCKENLPPLYYHKEESWYAPMHVIAGAMVARQHFKARPTDVLLATFPKSGTTWTKALLVAITNRDSDDPLANYTHPHDNVPFLEIGVYKPEGVLDVDSMPSPRMFSTHVPYQALPVSVVQSGCRIVYVWRDPKASFNSVRQYSVKIANKNSQESFPIEKVLEQYCDGVAFCGPCWDHILGYWKATNNKNMLFLKYEDMLSNPQENVKRLAEFIGKPFSVEEEQNGVLEKIIGLCSIDNLKSLEVIKSGSNKQGNFEIDFSYLFRKGEADDWKNNLTPEMVARLDEITNEKFHGSGLAL